MEFRGDLNLAGTGSPSEWSGHPVLPRYFQIMPLLGPTQTDFETGCATGAERPTLLVVDDEEGPRRALQVVFQDRFQVLLAAGGVEALRWIRERRVDVVILDIRMAGMSGIEVLEEIKRLDPAIEVLMLTAYETLETARQALRLGARDYLDKPFDIEAITTAVHLAMEQRVIGKEMQSFSGKLAELQAEIHNQKLREEINRGRGEIYASIIHDINGPLTIIAGFVEVINQRVSGLNQIEGESLRLVQDRLARISRQVGNCIEISRRYLTFLRGQAGTDSIINANQVLDDLRELLRAHPATAQARLTIRLLPEAAFVQGNATDFIQVMLNLTINALQCTPDPHQVEVFGEFLAGPLPAERFDERPNEVWVNHDGFDNAASLLAIHVQDDGPGVAPHLLKRVFDPYVTGKPTGKGTGLGLAIVRRLVQEAKGAICLRNEPGRGATFTLYLKRWQIGMETNEAQPRAEPTSNAE